MLDSPERLILGFITGIAFGVLLQKGRVAKHAVIVGQLLLRDFTVLKIMLTAIAVGAAGFWLLADAGMAPVDVKPAAMGGILTGAVLFGTGLTIAGYCPGTSVAAAGEGHRDAAMVVLGMLAGAFAFVQGFPALRHVQNAIVDWGKLTLPSATRVPAAAWITSLIAVVLTTYVVTRVRRGRRAM